MLTVSESICHVSTCEHKACQHMGACTGAEWREKHAMENLHQRAAELLADAARWGHVITIEQQSVPPLAMGN